MSTKEKIPRYAARVIALAFAAAVGVALDHYKTHFLVRDEIAGQPQKIDEKRPVLGRSVVYNTVYKTFQPLTGAEERTMYGIYLTAAGEGKKECWHHATTFGNVYLDLIGLGKKRKRCL